MDQLLIDSSSMDIFAFQKKEYNRHLGTRQVYFQAPRFEFLEKHCVLGGAESVSVEYIKN
jgi:hypothetical protein